MQNIRFWKEGDIGVVLCGFDLQRWKGRDNVPEAGRLVAVSGSPLLDGVKGAERKGVENEDEKGD